jgi:intracellular septation protein
VLTLVIVVISGGLTFGLNDERFFKMCTTVVCLTLSGVLWAGLWRGHSYLAALFENLAALPHEGWMLLTRRLARALLTLAAANEIMWRNFSTDVWVTYDAFVQPLAFFAFPAWQIRVARRTRR